MAYTYLTAVTYTANGEQTNFAIPFDYLRAAFIYVDVNGVNLTSGFEVSNRVLTFAEPPTKDSLIRIYRQTPTKRLVSWADASILKARDLEIARVQELHILEEQQDKANVVLSTANAALDDSKQTLEEAKEIKEAAATSATNANKANKEAQQANAEVKEIYNNGMLTPLTDLAGSIGTELKRWGTIFANKVFASNLPIMYNSVSDMKADRKLKAGMTACTLGYYAPNDGGAGTYIIRAKAEGDVDDGTYYMLDNMLIAKKIAIKPNQYIANTLEEAQLLLNNKHSIVINRNFNVKKSLNVVHNNITITFTKTGSFICKDLAIPCIIVGTDEKAAEFFRLENFAATGNLTTGSVGILIKKMGYSSELFRPHIFQFDKGIMTSSFDCMQLNTIYEPYLGQCNIGLDDSQGGMQACRIFGGRIEQNYEYGIVSASPNVHYIGTVLEGNIIANVKFYTIYSDLYKQYMPCGGTFSNCYFEALNDSEANIVLGDSEKNVMGVFNFIGCQCFLKGNTMPYIKQQKSDTGAPYSEKSITIIGGVCRQGTMFDLKEVETDTYIVCSNVYYTNTSSITDNVSSRAKIIVDMPQSIRYTNINKSNIYAGTDDTSTNITRPANIVCTKKLQLEATDAVKRETFVEFTQSKLLPWEDKNTGILKGSLHIYGVDGTWYIRVSTLNTVDTAANWKQLTLK